MRNYLYLLCCVALFGSCRQTDEQTLQSVLTADTRGKIISSTLLKTLADSAAVNQYITAINPTLGAIDVHYGVKFYKIIYNTIDPFGKTTQASGLCVIPINNPKVQGIASYQHGTIMVKEDVPSRPERAQESVIGVILGSKLGITVSMPDYLGLGDSPGMHPYIHAKTEASASIDMLRASKSLLKELKKTVSEQLFLFGYSQGGHATMAMHRELEQNYTNEFKVTAAAPMAGPYDVSGAQTKVLVSNDPYPAPYYAPYIALGYNYVYKMYVTPDEFLQSPYNATIPPLFLGKSSGGTINNAMGGTALPPNHIFRPDVLHAFKVTDTVNHPLRKALRDNDVYNWKPVAPMMLCHCDGDDHVSPMNTTVAYNAFKAKGVQDSMLTRVTPDANSTPIHHTECAFGCLLEGFSFISTFLN